MPKSFTFAVVKIAGFPQHIGQNGHKTSFDGM